MSHKDEGVAKPTSVTAQIEAVVRRVLQERDDAAAKPERSHSDRRQATQAEEDAEVDKLVERGMRVQRRQAGLSDAAETRAAELRQLRMVGNQELPIVTDPADGSSITAMVHLPGMTENSDLEKSFSGPPLTVRAKKRFLRAFRVKGIIGEGLYAGQVTRQTLRQWCKSDPVFGEYFMDAQETAADRMEAELWDRAMNGVEIRKYNKDGKLVDVYYQKSDLLLMFLLKGARPAKYKERLESTDQKSTMEALLAELKRLGVVEGEVVQSSTTVEVAK